MVEDKKLLPARVVRLEPIIGTEVCKLILEIPGYKGMDPGIGQFSCFQSLNPRKRFSRPFSIAEFGRSRKQAYFVFYIQKVGPPDSNTRAYARLKSGSRLLISQPRGKPFKLPASVNKWIVAAGGVGQAALTRLNPEFFRKINRRCEIVLGVKNRHHLYGLGVYEQSDYVHIATEEASEFNPQGLATDLLKEVVERNQDPSAAVIACGPPSMLKAAAKLCGEKRIGCYVVMEAMMGCGGMGSCLSCAIPMIDGSYKKCCVDGPVFKASDINWDLIPLNQANPKIASRALPSDSPLTVDLKGRRGNILLTLNSPLMAASGTLGLEEAFDSPYLKHAGAYVTKGICLHPRDGNCSPRICEVNGGAINSIGLPGKGIEKFLEEDLPLWQELGKLVILNVSAESIDDFTKLADILANKYYDGFALFDAIEINVSCPNTKMGGMAFGQDPEATRQVVQRFKLFGPDVPLIVKLTPNVTNVVDVAEAALRAKEDLIFSLVNTFTAMDIDIHSRRPKLGNNFGGLSGPGIMPMALYRVHQLFMAGLGAPIIGIGGISGGEDAIKFFLAGANAVMIGTEWMANKQIFDQAYFFINEYLKEQGCSKVDDIVGQLILN